MHPKILNANRASRRMICPGSYFLENTIPDGPPTLSQIEARLAKSFTLSKLQQEVNFKPDIIAIGTITEEMREGAILYCDFVKSKLPEDFQVMDLHIAETLELKFDSFNISGTPDCIFYNEENKTLYFFEYRFGHRYVQAFENWQMLEYVLLYMMPYQINSELKHKGIDNIEFHIIQPRVFHKSAPIDSWILNLTIATKYINDLYTAEKKLISQDNEVPCNPTSECYFCDANSICLALKENANVATQLANYCHPISNEPHAVGLELAELRKALKLIQARESALSQVAFNLIQAGNTVPGFTIEQSNGRQIWKHGDDKVITMGSTLGFDLMKEKVAITPKQALKLGIPETLINEWSEQTKGALKLTEQDINKARKIFSQTDEVL